MATQVLNPVDCAKEIVQVLEKHRITIYEMDEVLGAAKDIAISNTYIQSEKGTTSDVQMPQKFITGITQSKNGETVIRCEDFNVSPDDETDTIKKQIRDLKEKVQQLRDAAVLGKMPEF